MRNKTIKGHLSALVTILIWGTTFISTKVLLEDFTPIEILFIRFAIGYFALWCVCPHKLKPSQKKQEWYFAAAGLCGVTLYYLFENIALTYTSASNVGVIISIAPFFTAIFSYLFLQETCMSTRFFTGFFIAMSGVAIISFGNGASLQLNPLGDVLAIIAAVIWAFYSNLVKMISGLGYNIIQNTRRIFFYGLLFMIPVLPFSEFRVSFSQVSSLKVIFNILFLSLGASALCFVTWNLAIKVLGSVKTCLYIYAVPVIAAVASAVILQEKMTFATILGIALTLTGLFISEQKKSRES